MAGVLLLVDDGGGAKVPPMKQELVDLLAWATLSETMAGIGTGVCLRWLLTPAIWCANGFCSHPTLPLTNETGSPVANGGFRVEEWSGELVTETDETINACWFMPTVQRQLAGLMRMYLEETEDCLATGHWMLGRRGGRLRRAHKRGFAPRADTSSASARGAGGCS